MKASRFVRALLVMYILTRMAALRAKLGAWPISGSFEPRNALIDQAFCLISDSAVKYIARSGCSSRKQGIVSERIDDTPFRLEASGCS